MRTTQARLTVLHGRTGFVTRIDPDRLRRQFKTVSVAFAVAVALAYAAAALLIWEIVTL
jgi:hypothetical protein